MEILNKIQKELKAPKNQKNNFGNYNYRSCEDILEAVKPLLGDAILTLTDEVINIGDRYYVKATATLDDNNKSISVSAFARESEIKKGMDSAQITGAASSYARKYALNGLFLIDDTKDADTMDNKTPVKKEVDPNTKKKATIKELVKELKSDIKDSEMKDFIEEKTKLKIEDKNLDDIITNLGNLLQEKEENEIKK